MAKIMFVDDRIDEVIHQWQLSGCSSNHELLHLEPFDSIERVCQVVKSLEPDLILIGYGLGKPGTTGADVIRSLREQGFTGCVIANSGDGLRQFERVGVEVNGTANRNSYDLKTVLDNLTEEKK